MGITNSNKELSTQRIDCGDSFRVRLSLTAEPDIVTSPTDIVLVLDRSGSMAGSALANLKNGAKAFIDIISDATGSTNHADAFTKAAELLATPSGNARVMVMFTDGQTTTGPNPGSVAAAARAAGVVIYAIGLSGNGGVDVAALENWASKPASAYVAITPDDAELEEIFAELARNIANPGATDVVITDRVSPCFRITSVAMPTRGTASLQDANTVQWQIEELGVTQSEGAVLEFTVQHIGPCSGALEVNESISYDDAEGNVVSFPSPELEVDCDIVVQPELCPEPVELTVDGCEDTLAFDAGDLGMDSLGRIVQLSVTLQNVCPNRRVALAAVLTEVDDRGMEHQRGMKTMLIPGHNRDMCQDVTVRCMKFVLPESLSVSGAAASICNARNFKARFIANYIDNDFACCDTVL